MNKKIHIYCNNHNSGHGYDLYRSCMRDAMAVAADMMTDDMTCVYIDDRDAGCVVCGWRRDCVGDWYSVDVG